MVSHALAMKDHAKTNLNEAREMTGLMLTVEMTPVASVCSGSLTQPLN